MSCRLILTLIDGHNIKPNPQTSPLRFATDEEALSFGKTLLEPSQTVESWKVEETALPPNYSYRNNKLVAL